MTYTRSCLLIILSLALNTVAQAQLPQTRLYSLSRLGGQVGTQFELQLTSGADLDEVSQLQFNHPGITATQKTNDVNGEQVPVVNTFNVNIAADVSPGIYELRCSGLFGLSNPRRFAVGQRTESIEVEDNNASEKATPLELNTLVNGRLQAGSDVDWYRITGTKGQRIILDCWAERLDAKLDAALSIYDGSGQRRLVYLNNTKGADPTLVFDVPAAGEYLVKLHDQTYKNGNEFVYRLAVHTGPHLEVALPASGQANTTQKFTLLGYNLPQGKLTDKSLRGNVLEAVEVEIPLPTADTLHVENRVSAMGSGTDSISYRLPSDSGVSNPIQIGITPDPVIAEIEPNDQSSQAQQIIFPIEVGGLFATVGDSDIYRFEAKKDQVLFIEAVAERMGLLTDPFLIVSQIIKKEDGTEENKRLTALDDVATTLLVNVFETKTDDPVYKLQVPADGTYEVTVRDRYWESRGAANLAYRLSIHEARPDFRIVAIPASPTAGQTWPLGLRNGDNFPLSIFAFRKDGYEGPIEVTAATLPAGFTCPTIILSDKETNGTLIISTKSNVAPGDYQIALQGKAVINNQEVTHPARTSTIVWSTGNNIPAITRVTNSFACSVLAEEAPFQILPEQQQVLANQSQQILIPVMLEKRNAFDEKVTFTPQGLSKSANIDIKLDPIEKGASSNTLRIFVKDNSPPGLYTLWFNSTGQVSYRHNPAKAERLAKLHEQAKKVVEEATKVRDEITSKKNAAITLLTQASEKVTQVQASIVAKQAEVAALKEQLAQATMASQLATTQLTAAQSQVTSLEQQLAAAMKEESEAATAKQLELAQQQVVAKTALESATVVQTEAAQKLLQITENVKAADQALVNETEALRTAQADMKKADDNKKTLESEEQNAQREINIREPLRVQAEKAATEAATAATAKNLNFTPPSTPIIIEVKAAPLKLTAIPDGEGKLKQSEQVQVKVKITRQNEFKGPVKLTLPTIPGIAGITADTPEIPAYQTDGTITLTASADATEGALANLVLRATADFNGEAAVDIPITITVNK